MPENNNNSQRPVIACALVLGGVLVLDVLAPPALAVGVLYLLPLFLLVRFNLVSRIWLFAGLGSVFIVAGLLIDLAVGFSAANVLAQLLALAMLWFAATIMQRCQRKNREEVARGQLFGALIASAPDATVVVDRHGAIMLANRQVEALFGYTEEELVGQPVEVLIPGRFSRRHVQHREGYFGAPKVRSMGQGLELYAKRKGGDEFPVEISLSPLQTSEGLLVSAAIRDLTERKKAEDKFRGLLEAAPDAMVIVNETGTIQYTNQQTEKLFGYPSGELLGAPVEKLMPQRFREVHGGHTAKFFTAPAVRGMGQGLELYGATRDGVEFPVEISLSPLQTEDGLLVSAAIRDISERKQADRELKQYAHELEAKNREMEQFAYIASHDLQEPLRTVTSFVDLLAMDYKGQLDEHADEYIRYIKDATARMSALIKDLLDYSRIGRERKLTMVDCNKLLGEVIADLRQYIADNNATVTYENMPVFPGYEAELRLLFQNLVSNAIKFHVHGRPPKVHVTAKQADGAWMFSVTDNGIGIDTRYLDKIFVIFQRLHSNKEFEGTGIGLAHCKKIVDLMGGDIWVESVPGEGSTFHFTAPVPKVES